MKQSTLRKLITLAMLAVLCIFFTAKNAVFMSAGNLTAILRDASVAGIVGVGLTCVILTAGIDLSTGSVIALVGMTMANVYEYTLWPIWVMILLGLLVGALCGLVNGFVVAKLHIPEFIGTLATMGIFRSLTYVIAVDESYQMRTAEFVRWGGKAASFRLGGQNVDIYWVVIALLVITLLGQLLLKKTRLGTNLYAVGSNPKAAQLSGINTENTRIMAFVITGLLAAVGGVFQTARLQSTQVLLADSFNFDPIAAAVIGGCALDGGEGDCIGTLLGAIFMAALNSGIMKLGLSSAWQNVIKGIIIILVVLFDAWYRRFMSTRAMKRKAQQSGTEVA